MKLYNIWVNKCNTLKVLRNHVVITGGTKKMFIVLFYKMYQYAILNILIANFEYILKILGTILASDYLLKELMVVIYQLYSLC